MIENQLIIPHPEELLQSKSFEGCDAHSVLSSYPSRLALWLAPQDEGGGGRHG
jgi:hypothetical protein